MAIESKIREDDYMVTASIHKKETEWGEKHNYIGDGELRTTITLDEYRELLTENATMKEKLRANITLDEYKGLLTENATMKEKLRALQEYVDGIKAKAKIEEEDDF